MISIQKEGINPIVTNTEKEFTSSITNQIKDDSHIQENYDKIRTGLYNTSMNTPDMFDEISNTSNPESNYKDHEFHSR